MEEPEYHGEFVKFDKMKMWPSRTRSRIRRSSSAAGWNTPPSARSATATAGSRATTGWNPKASSSTQFRKMAADAGRDPKACRSASSVIPRIDRLKLCQDLGIDRVVFTLPAEKEDKLLPIMDRWADLKRRLNGG